MKPRPYNARASAAVEVHNTAIQAAREAVAKRYAAPSWGDYADLIRAGKYDREGEVEDFIAGALAALDAVRPMIREAALREAAPAVCKHCAAGVPFMDGGRWHALSSAHISQCHAMPILALQEKPE